MQEVLGLFVVIKVVFQSCVAKADSSGILELTRLYKVLCLSVINSPGSYLMVSCLVHC